MELDLKELFKPRLLRAPHWQGVKGKKKSFFSTVINFSKHKRHQGKRECERRMRQGIV